MKSSATMETIVVMGTTEALKESQVRRLNAVRNNEYTPGVYLFIPMKHFCTEVEYQGQKYASKRLLAFKVTEVNGEVEYVRTFKIAYLTESLAALKQDGCPVIAPVTNADGRLRIPNGALTYTNSCNDRIPKSVGEDNMLYIDAPFYINFKGTLQGYNPHYVETAAGSGLWDVEVDEEGNAVFEATRITQFDVLPDAVKDEVIAAAKICLAEDSQLKSVKVD